MEYRKLISFGKSSFVVSLPKPWIDKHKLKKGDIIHFDETDTNLVLMPKQLEKEKEEKEIVINIEGKKLKRIQREIIASYIRNFKTIILMGKEIKDKAKEIQEFVQKLVALEIVEQDSKKIVAKDFLSLNDISIDQIIRKMDIISRSMFSDCKNMFKEDNCESIYLRDKDINKFRFLVYRIVWFGMENPVALLKNFNLDQIGLFNRWWMSFNIEQVGDGIKRIARYMKEIKFSKTSKKEFIQLLEKIEKDYLELLKAFYNNNIEIAHEVVDRRGKLIEECEAFFAKNRNIPLIGYLMHSTKALVVDVNSIGRLIYQNAPF